MLPKLGLGDGFFVEVVATSVGRPTFRECLFILDYAKGELRIASGALPEAAEVTFDRAQERVRVVPRNGEAVIPSEPTRREN